MSTDLNLGGAARFSRTRGRMGGSTQGSLGYPSPFFDVGHTYLPASVKELFRYCRYYFFVHPLINTVITKMSETPITDIVLSTDNSSLRDTWTSLLEEDLHYRAFLLDSGLDYYTYGNLLVSIFYPFRKMLRCKDCTFIQPIKEASYQFRSYGFHWTCPKCGAAAEAEAFDETIRTQKGLRLLRWNPEDVDIRYNDLNGEYTYYYDIPLHIKNDIIMGKKHIIENVPQLFIEALKKNKAIVFSKDNIFHLRRPTLAGKDRGWGMPLLLPVLKDAFYLQLLKKSQEAICLEHIIPLRIMFPQAGSADSNPYSTINLRDWKESIHEELQRWRLDPNYIPILPLPVGNQSIGGDGRALLLGQEIRVWSEQIVTGMGYPAELIFGGVSWSGTNVSLRSLENTHLGYMMGQLKLLKWVMTNVGTFLNWPVTAVHFKPFKMADDLQRKAYNFQLNQAGKISDQTLLRDSDFDPEQESKNIKDETARRGDAEKKARLAQAQIEGEANMIMQRFQIKAQAEAQQIQMQQSAVPGEPGSEGEGVGEEGPATVAEQPPAQGGEAPNVQSDLRYNSQEGQMNVDLVSYAQQMANYLKGLGDDEQQAYLMNLRSQQPELYTFVLELMNASPPEGGGFAESESAGKPLPEQRAPNRDAASAMI